MGLSLVAELSKITSFYVSYGADPIINEELLVYQVREFHLLATAHVSHAASPQLEMHPIEGSTLLPFTMIDNIPHLYLKFHLLPLDKDVDDIHLIVDNQPLSDTPVLDAPLLRAREQVKTKVQRTQERKLKSKYEVAAGSSRAQQHRAAINDRISWLRARYEDDSVVLAIQSAGSKKKAPRPFADACVWITKIAEICQLDRLSAHLPPPDEPDISDADRVRNNLLRAALTDNPRLRKGKITLTTFSIFLDRETKYLQHCIKCAEWIRKRELEMSDVYQRVKAENKSYGVHKLQKLLEAMDTDTVD